MRKRPLQRKAKIIITTLGLVCAASLATGCFGGAVRVALVSPPRVTVKRVACGPGTVRVSGYWEYNAAGDYVWIKGRCVTTRSGCSWAPGRYKTVRRGRVRVKVWRAGKWRCGGRPSTTVVVHPKPKPKPKPTVVVHPKPKPKPKPTVVVHPKPKPKPSIIVVNPPPPKGTPRKPMAGKIWIRGHYAWNSGTHQYEWVPGRFKKRRPGKRWNPGSYKVEIRAGYKIKIWIPGHWR